MKTILVFKNMIHYSDCYIRLKESENKDSENMDFAYTKQEIDKPIMFEVNSFFSIDWSMMRAKTMSWRENSGQCPLCFWNNMSLCYVKPYRDKVTNKYVERWLACPHKIYDVDMVNKWEKGNLSEGSRAVRENYPMSTNWKSWVSQLQR